MSVPDAAEHARVSAALKILDSLDAQVRAISQQRYVSQSYPNGLLPGLASCSFHSHAPLFRTMNPIIDYTDAAARSTSCHAKPGHLFPVAVFSKPSHLLPLPLSKDDRAALLATISSLEAAIARVGIDSFPVPLPPYPGSLTDIPTVPPAAPAATAVTASAFTDAACARSSLKASATVPTAMDDVPVNVASSDAPSTATAVALHCPLSSPPAKATSAFTSGSAAAVRRTEARIVAAAERASASDEGSGALVTVGVGETTASVPSSAMEDEDIATGAAAVVVAAALQAAASSSAAAAETEGASAGSDSAAAAESSSGSDSFEAAELLRRCVADFDIAACVATCGGRAVRQKRVSGAPPASGSGASSVPLSSEGGLEGQGGATMSDGDAAENASVDGLSLQTGVPEWVVEVTAPDAVELGKRMEAVAYLTLLYHSHVKEKLALGDRRVKRAEREWQLAQS